MHDTDMAGVLYFARQFRFAHDALEDCAESEGLGFDRVFHKENFVFVIVHAEADYLVSLKVGDSLEIHLSIERVGNSSFTVDYQIYRQLDNRLVGTAKTVHVTLDSKTRKKIPIPEALRAKLQKHLK
jgi:1,4-dihydroxy-2-naphthoyl-CoA hydrolase